MSLGDFEPDVWVPSRHPAVRRGTIGLDELARMEVIHGPRRLEPRTGDVCAGGVKGRVGCKTFDQMAGGLKA